MTRIVGVHGVGNYHYCAEADGDPLAAAAAVGAGWSAALTAGLPAGMPVDLRVGYYAHHLHRGTPQGADDDPALLPPEAQEMLIDWAEQLRSVPEIPLGPRTRRARQAVEWTTRRFGAAAAAGAVAFFREVHAYLADPGSPRRTAARDEVAAAIAGHEPRIVIAHSLGTVVAYEALWAHPELGVDLLITLGSPLGMRGVVFDRLAPVPENGRGNRPPGVRRWANLADTGDLIAIPRDLPGLFDGIDVHRPDLVIGDWSFHAVARYLVCAQTIEALRPLLSHHG